MGKSFFIGIIAVFAIIFMVVIASAFGFIDLGFNIFQSDDPADPNNINLTSGSIHPLGLSDREIHQAISLLTNSSPPFAQHQVFIRGLHMKVYGIDGTTAYGVLQDYENTYVDEGFTSYNNGVKHGIGWTAYAEIWYNDIGMGRAITVADGSSVHNAYGYDVVLITSYGPVIDYYDYVNFISMY